MRLLLLPILLCIPVVAMSQVPQISPQDEALQQRIIGLTSDALSWQTQAIAEKRRADDLQKQLDALKKPEPAK